MCASCGDLCTIRLTVLRCRSSRRLRTVGKTDKLQEVIVIVHMAQQGPSTRNLLYQKGRWCQCDNTTQEQRIQAQGAPLLQATPATAWNAFNQQTLIQVPLAITNASSSNTASSATAPSAKASGHPPTNQKATLSTPKKCTRTLKASRNS